MQKVEDNLYDIIGKLKSKDLYFLSCLYDDKDFPYNVVHNEEIMKLLNCSRATVSVMTKRLERLNLIERKKLGFIMSYYPIRRSNPELCIKLHHLFKARRQGKIR